MLVIRECDKFNCVINVLGECCSLQRCSHDYAPICDTEGTTHINECAFAYAQCLSKQSGSTQPLMIKYNGS